MQSSKSYKSHFCFLFLWLTLASNPINVTSAWNILIKQWNNVILCIKTKWSFPLCCISKRSQIQYKVKLIHRGKLTRIFLPYTDAYWESSQLFLKIFHFLYKILHALVTMTLPKASFHVVSRITRKNAVSKLPTERTSKFPFVDWKTLEDLVILEGNKEDVAEICSRLDFIVLGVLINRNSNQKL